MKRPRLSTQIVLLQLAIIILTVSAGFAVSLIQARRQLDRSAGRESLMIAQTVAGIPAIRRAFATPDPARDIDPIAERIRKLTGASFVTLVVTDAADGTNSDHADWAGTRFGCG